MANEQNLIGHGFDKHPERINKKGRPPMPDINAAMANVLNGDAEGMTALEAILEALIKKAKKGDVRAAQLLFDRCFGKPKQSIEMGTPRPIIKGITFNPEP